MSSLQWALLLLGVGIVVALIWSSRREKRALDRCSGSAAQTKPANRDWSAGDDALPGFSNGFDEHGVSKPRTLRPAAPAAAPSKARIAPEAAAAPRIPEKLIGLYIAEHEGTNILGPKLHAALQDQGLRFGAKRIYHRYEGERSLYSVASLVKPGALDPAQAAEFSTPGLSIFMLLPGPARPVAAFQDMLSTARQLARLLNAELYDTERRAPLTPERERELHAQVEDWARRYAPV